MTATAFGVSLEHLRVETSDGDPIVDDVGIRIAPGEILGLVGESGSGKSTTGLSILGYATPGATIVTGRLSISGEILGPGRSAMSARGRLVTYVPQNPGTALNPALRIGTAIEDMLAAHRPDLLVTGAVHRALESVGLPATDSFARRFPHQLSGGQQQRVCVAIALVCEPALVVLDEPTTGLDVLTQSQILGELTRLRDQLQIAMLYVTHDLSVVAQIADRVAVMYAGRIVEEGPTPEVLRRPRHPYSRGLTASIPDHATSVSIQAMPGSAVAVGDRPPGCPFAPRCLHRTEQCAQSVPYAEDVAPGHSVRCYNWSRTQALVAVTIVHEPDEGTNEMVVLDVRELKAEHRTRGERIVAASGVSFVLRRGESVALVGESGSGKTTIARTIAGLHPLAGGTVVLHGEQVAGTARHRTVAQRRRLQLIFQNPADALNPRHTVRESIGRPARMFGNLSGCELQGKVETLLDSVRLPARLAERYPTELSGGERQRVAIARALAADPDVLVCDEITSALDVSVQAAVLDLLAQLRRELGVSLVFVTHDLGVVSLVADSVLVLESGVVCENGPTQQLLTSPQHPYTQRLLAAAPSLSSAIRSWDHHEGLPAQHIAD